MNDEEAPNTTPSAQPEAQPKPAETPPNAETEDKAKPARSTPSPTVLTIAFIIITLLGIVITQNVLPKSGNSGQASESPAFDSLKADIASRRALLNRERIEMGLEPIGGGLGMESAENVAARLKADADTLASLAKSFEDLLAQKEALLAESRMETVNALKEQRRLRDQLEAINNDLRRAMIDASMASTMKSDLARARDQILALQTEIDRLRLEPATLRQQLAECSSARLLLQRQVAELENQIAIMQGELTRVSLFANSESDILKEAIALFQALRKLQGSTPNELAVAYSRFGAELGADVLKTCTFPTGSSQVPIELETGIITLPDEIPANAMIFVAGYASETGNVDSNRTLSSDRATAVARILDSAKRPGQKVQAVYLGQTKRFSPKDPVTNQRVEIWQILPKIR